MTLRLQTVNQIIERANLVQAIFNNHEPFPEEIEKRQHVQEILLLGMEIVHLRSLLKEIYNHGEDTTLHGRIRDHFGVIVGEQIS